MIIAAQLRNASVDHHPQRAALPQRDLLLLGAEKENA
jgi:hypothetical protein